MSEIRCGVELEFVAPYPSRIAAELPEPWQFDHYDVEAVSPIYTTNAALAAGVGACCAALKRLGCSPHVSCGLHVHLSRQHLGARREARLLQRYYEELPALNARWPQRSRALSADCTMLATGVPCSGCRPACGRHAALDTIEVRQHPSTLDPSAIVLWVRTLYAWAGRA